ncbi:MAG: DUF2334 domain-containing protein, partial [Burkholderiaceae bacterium]
WRALQTQPFDYTCTLRRLYLLPGERSISCQSQVYSSANGWRRATSVLWNATLAAWQRDRPIVRLELHPTDLHPLLQRSWRKLATEQARTRRVCTLQSLAQTLR